MSNKQKRKSENNDDEEEVKRLKIEQDQFKDELKQTKEQEEQEKNKKQDKLNKNKECGECGDKQSECGELKDGKCGACIRDLDPEYEGETVEEFMKRHPTGKPSQQQKRMNHLISEMQAELTSLSEMQQPEMQAEEEDKEEEEKKKVKQHFLGLRTVGPRQSTLSEFFS